MYPLIRRVHLFTGLLLLVFVLMYFASGYVMVHNEWFNKPGPATTTRTETLNYSGESSDEVLSRYLQETFDLRGKRNPPNHRKDGSRQFNYTRPGTTFEAVVSPDGKQVAVTRKEFGFVGLANGMHRLHGYGGGRIYDAWAFLYDLASAALILFALTGIILWYQSTSRRLPGLICLGLSFGFSAAMILYLLYRK
jgi:hypothetical protein